MKILVGIQPTGNIHIGNYLGTLKKAIELQEEHEVLFMIADLHSMTTVGGDKKHTAKELEALGAKNIFFQSSMRHESLFWELCCKTKTTSLTKMPQYKDKKDNIKNVGFLTYPVLMAADIIASKADIVLVGNDQEQHMELARKLCRINNFDEPTTLKTESPRIMSLTDSSRKMSKSEEKGCLFMWDLDAKRKIMKAVTDRKGRKNLENIFYGLGGKKAPESNSELKKIIINLYENIA